MKLFWSFSLPCASVYKQRGREPESPGQGVTGLRADPPLAVQDLTDRGHGQARLFGKLGLGDAVLLDQVSDHLERGCPGQWVVLGLVRVDEAPQDLHVI